MKKELLKCKLEITALNKANDVLAHSNKSLIREKTLYESELDILCSRIEKAIKYSREHKINKIEMILKGE